MCRNIKTLLNFKPPATKEEVHASALQYVRKLTGMQKPSHANERAFEAAVEKITRITFDLFDHLEIHTEPRTREEEQRKAVERGKKREAQLRERYGGTERRKKSPAARRSARE